MADHLEPFQAAAPNGPLSDCFRAQALDERRHSRFFDRVWREILQSGGGGVAAALAGAARFYAGSPLVELFEDVLPRRATALANGAPIASAVGLYHLVLEGMVFSAGQDPLSGFSTEAGTLPGLSRARSGCRPTSAGTSGSASPALREAGAAQLDLDEPIALALSAWSPAVRRRVDVDRVVAGHLRRMRLADQGGLDHVPDVGHVLVDRGARPLAGVDRQ